jgi:hypothetical protein
MVLDYLRHLILFSLILTILHCWNFDNMLFVALNLRLPVGIYVTINLFKHTLELQLNAMLLQYQ